MKTIENNRIRVTISDKIYAKYLTPAREQVLPSGDTRTHSIADETRGRILSTAMKALAHRQVVNSDLEIDIEAGRQTVTDGYIYEYLKNNTRYDLAEIIMRINGGHRLSTGQRSDYSDAQAYAKGIMGGISITDITTIGSRIIDSKKPSDRRAWNRLALMRDKNATPDIVDKIITAAKRIAQQELDYSKHFIFPDFDIEILTPDDIPEQIGLQDYAYDK